MDVDKESTASSNLVGNDIIEFPAGYVYWKFDRHWPIFFQITINVSNEPWLKF